MVRELHKAGVGLADGYFIEVAVWHDNRRLEVHGIVCRKESYGKSYRATSPQTELLLEEMPRFHRGKATAAVGKVQAQLLAKEGPVWDMVAKLQQEHGEWLAAQET